jgi:hypothetical protein
MNSIICEDIIKINLERNMKEESRRDDYDSGEGTR